MTYQVHNLREGLGFGKEIVGLTHDDIKREDVRNEIRDYWLTDGLVVFRGSEVTPDFHADLSRILGELEIHPIPSLHSKHSPEVITLVSDQRSEGLYEIDGVKAIAFLPWHSDLVYLPQINRGGVLTATKISSWGGLTGFIDQGQAYDQLPDRLKAEIEDLEIVYQLCVNPGAGRYGTKSTFRTLQQSEFETSVGPRVDRDFPPVVHPVVFRHPDSGRKILNISPFSALYILGRDDEAGHALLQELVDHLVACPAYFHQWQPSEMVMWDNWRMMHCVTGAAPDEIRIVDRTTIKGDYGLGRRLQEQAAA